MNPITLASDSVKVIAHRGASHDRPENTFAAFEEAIRSGCDGIELDLQFTRDEVPVVFHDRTLEKMGAGTAAIHELDFYEARRVDVGAWFGERYTGQRIATLDEVLDALAGRTRLLLEVKAREGGRRLDGLARSVARRVAELPDESDAYILSFSAAALASARDERSTVRTVLNMRSPAKGLCGLPSGEERLFALCMDQRKLDASFVEAAHQLGKPVFSYTVNEADDADRLVTAGVDALISDKPAWLREHLGEGARQ